MSSHPGPEYTEVQRPAWELLKDHYGYEYADGESSKVAAERESETDPLLIGRLSKKLCDINEGLTEDGVRQAIAALRQPLASTLIDANETCHRLLGRWVTVEEVQQGIIQALTRQQEARLLLDLLDRASRAVKVERFEIPAGQ